MQGGVEVLGRSFSLECVVMRGYVPDFRTVHTWYKDGAEMEDQSSRVLRFSRVRDADEGEYTCTVREAAEETTSPRSIPYSLHPLVSPELHIKPASPDNVTKGILGENLTLTCEVTRAFPGVPADGFSWSYLPSSQGQRRPLEGKASTLTLGPLTREDGGQYFCQARNDQDLSQFKDLKLIGNVSVTVHIVYLESITLTSDLEVKEGDPVTLTCSVDSLPKARLVWTVHGQEVRHVTDNLDHYVIPRADCSNSTSYTCRASNTDLPGREMSASTQVHVLPCNDAPANLDNSTAETAATLDFRLPNQTPIVVVHPRGQAMVTVQPDCSLNIYPAFLPRLLHPRCDPAQRVLTFTLTKVTEEDEGNYTCREDGPRGKLIPSCGKTLQAPGVDSSQVGSPTWSTALIAALGTLIAFVVLSVVLLVVLWRSGGLARCIPCAGRSQESCAAHDTRHMELRERRPLVENHERETQSTDTTRLLPVQGGKEEFEARYSRGQVHVIPPFPAQQLLLEGGQAELRILGKEEARVCVILLLRDLLEAHTRPGDPPVFVFTRDLLPHMHVVIYHSICGVILVKAEAVSSSDSLSSTLVKAAWQLSEARRRVEAELGDLIGPDAVSLLLALPNLENRGELGDSLRELFDELDVQPLCGRKTDVVTWHQFPFTRVERPVWRKKPDSYQAFVTAVSRHLCLEGYIGSQTEGGHSRLLASPEQAAVLRCTDKRLHICGPPGSGKSLLGLDRVRRWLERGKTVVVAVCTPDFQLLLHRLGREALRGLTTDAVSRLTLCCDLGELQKTLRDLGQRLPPSSVCVFIDNLTTDNLDSGIYSDLLEASRSAAVECVWTAGQRDLPAPASTQLQSLGRRSVLLSLPLRCHSDLLPAGPLTPALADPPSLTAHLPPASVKVTLHPSHPGYRRENFPRLDRLGYLIRGFLRLDPSSFKCEDCSQELRSSLSPLMERLPLEHERWRHWVILLTGDWGPDSRVRKSLVIWLREQGVPAVPDWRFQSQVSSLPASSLLDLSRGQGSQVGQDGAALRARVLLGEETEKRPAVHVISASHFTGLEKARVLVVHYDWRDDHPDHQSQEQRDARLSEHRDQLFQAVTRSQTELAVWLLSPSPAASLLPDNEVEATAAAEQEDSQAPSLAAPAAAVASVVASEVPAPAASAPPAALRLKPAVPAPAPAARAAPVAVVRSNVQQHQHQQRQQQHKQQHQ